MKGRIGVALAVLVAATLLLTVGLEMGQGAALAADRLVLPPAGHLAAAPGAQGGLESPFKADLPLLSRGFSSGASQPTTPTFLPIIYRGYYSLPVFGVHLRNVDNAGGLAQARDAKMLWVRSSPIAWDLIEPVRTNPPAYKWWWVDEADLQAAAQNGLKTIATVQFAPDWAQKVAGQACGPIKQDALDEFAQFLQVLVTRYSVPPYNVHYWELGNEPDVDVFGVLPRNGYGCWGDTSDPYFGGAYYAEMLKVAYPAIKAADPGAQVLIGGLLLDCDPDNPPPGNTCTSSRFLEGILLGGGGPYFDLVSFHAYAYYDGVLGDMSNTNWGAGAVTVLPEKVAFLQSVLQQYGFAKKGLISTEAALLCWVSGDTDCYETQAVYVPRVYAEAIALGLKGQTYYEMINDEWYDVGLLNHDLSPKPAYLAYRTMTGFLAYTRYVGGATGYPPGIEGYGFRKKDYSNRIDLIWSGDGSSVTVPLPTGATAYDRYGTLVGSSGTIQVDFGPVYVVAP